MARGSKVVINRARLNAVTRAVADALFVVAEEIIDDARPPDSPYEPWPIGEGLPKQGGALAYFDGKKVAGWGQDGKQPRAPRAAHIRSSVGIVVIVGWGFPARFNEFGTVKMAPQPFFTPAVDRVTPRTIEIMRPILSAHLGRIR